jgi:8-oxo-dGTP pyrophosphatase MutT (NUDIX family)
LPGGILELNESLPECVVREVHEETGLTVKPTRLVGIYSSPDFDVTYPNDDQVQQVTACFECRLAGREGQGVEQTTLVDTVETLELAWFNPEEPPPTAPWYAAMVADLNLGWKAARFDRGSPGDGREGEPFFQRIRRHIGQEAFVMPAAAAFIQDSRGRILLQRRGDTGGWGLPGGAMELGERLDQTVIHEVREETGLVVEPLNLIGIYSDASFWYSYPHGDQVKVVSALFECQISGGQLRADGVESLEVRFFAPDALPPMTQRHARRVRDGLAGKEETLF